MNENPQNQRPDVAIVQTNKKSCMDYVKEHKLLIGIVIIILIALIWWFAIRKKKTIDVSQSPAIVGDEFVVSKIRNQ